MSTPYRWGVPTEATIADKRRRRIKRACDAVEAAAMSQASLARDVIPPDRPIRGRSPILVEPTPGVAREELTRRADYASQILYMARLAKGRPSRAWPAWEPEEVLAVAVVLNDNEALRDMGLHMVEAVLAVSVDMGISEMRAVMLRAMEGS